MNNTRIIIISTFCLLFLSISFLAYTGNKQQSSNYSQNWWAVYFSDPKSQNLSFEIENHIADSNFHWEIFSDKNSISKGDITIKLGETKTIKTSQLAAQGKKTTIIVTNGKDKKEIYKIL